MRNEVLARLGYDPFTPDAKRTVTASITRSRSTLRAHLELREPGSSAAGSRTLESTKNDCRELASAMVLAITIAIDPPSLTRPAPLPVTPTPEPERSPPPTPAEPPPVETAQTTPPVGPPTSDVHGVLGVLAGAGFGLTPGVSLAPRLLVGIESRRWTVNVEGRFYLPSEASAGTRSVRASLLLGALAPCLRAELASSVGLEGRACAVLALGRMAGSGTGVDVALEGSSLYAAAGPRAALELPLGRRVALLMQTDVFAPLVDTRLRLNGADVWSSSPVVVDVALGAIARVP